MRISIFSGYGSSWDYYTFSKHVYRCSLPFHNLFFSLNDVLINRSLAADAVNCISAAQPASLVHSINICQAVLKMLGIDSEQNSQWTNATHCIRWWWACRRKIKQGEWIRKCQEGEGFYVTHAAVREGYTENQRPQLRKRASQSCAFLETFQTVSTAHAKTLTWEMCGTFEEHTRTFVTGQGESVFRDNTGSSDTVRRAYFH